MAARQPAGKYAPSLAAKIFIGIFNLIGTIALRQFENRTVKAIQTNNESLAKIVRLNRNTLFGRQHRFDLLVSANHLIEAYKRVVPLTSFDAYENYIELISSGKDNVLTCDPVDLFAGSAGTTDASKRLPSTRRARSKFMFFMPLVQRGVLGRFIEGANFAGRGINLMSLYTPPPNRGTNPSTMSANNAGMKRVRQAIPVLWCSPEAVFNIKHQPTADYLHALFGLADRNVLHISAIFSSHLNSFFAQMKKHQNQLLRDIKFGTLAGHLVLTETERKTIQNNISPDPMRAEELKMEFSAGIEGIIPRLWPNIKYLAAVTTGSFSIYVPRLRLLTGDQIPIYSPCHAASEAIIGINLQVDCSDYVLACGSAFFEFIHLSQASEEQPVTLCIDQVKVGDEYEVVITTFAGLYRYRLGDVIRITGMHGTAPIFEFLYRKGAILNLVGEKMTEYMTTKALTACLKKCLGTNSYLKDFSVAGQASGNNMHYTFYVELHGRNPLTRPGSENIAIQLDRELCKINYYYWSNGRNAERLGSVRLKFVAPGAFDSLNSLQNGRSNGVVANQIKTPRIVNLPEQIDTLEKAVYLSTTGKDIQYVPGNASHVIQGISD